jgi:vancomycin resistance protein VanW
MALLDLLPRALRVELARARRWPRWIGEARRLAPVRGGDDFAYVIARHASPLRRPGTLAEPRLQAGKETNVALAASRLDRALFAPGAVLSYHHAVGRPARWRGFLPGLELHGGELAEGVGGGACQVANLLYYLALLGALTIVERHRHTLDLFPDADRRVPFGCGATVFYNWADLRIANPLDTPITLRLTIERGELVGELRAPEPAAVRVEVYEVDHRFFADGGAWWRENRIRRRIVRAADGALLVDHEVAHNLARVAYTPAAAVARSA